MRGFLIVRLACVAGALALAPAWLQAQPMPTGPEFQVNTYTTVYQRSASVATDAAGNFVVVWQSSKQDGGFWGVFGQRYDNIGAAQGPEFQVNTYTTDDQVDPRVASDSGGNFVVVWASRHDGYSGFGVFARRFTSAGEAQGAEFQVNTYTSYNQVNPAVARHADGNFVVVWQSFEQDGEDGGIFGQRFDNDGVRLGSEFQVNTYTTSYQYPPAVAIDGTGNFIVVWASYGQEDGSGIFGQRYDATGAAQGGEFQVNTYSEGYQLAPAVAASAAGDFLVVWQSGHQDGDDFGVFGQRYDASGVAQGDEFQVNTFTTRRQGYPAVAAGASGGFVVVWESYFPDPNGDVFGQRYDGAGNPLGPEFQVNTYTTSYQNVPAIGAEAGGTFAVVWDSGEQDGEYSGVFGQRFSVITVSTTTTSSITTSTSSTTSTTSDTTSSTTTSTSSTTSTTSDTTSSTTTSTSTTSTTSSSSTTTTTPSTTSTTATIPSTTTTTLQPRPISGKGIVIADSPNVTKRRIIFRANSSALATLDPVAQGAVLHVFNPGGSTDSACLPLPASGWVAKGPTARRTHRYLDAGFANGPCRMAVLKKGKTLKVVCLAKAKPIAYSLDEAQQGSVAANLTSGGVTYCALFGGKVVQDSGAKRRFVAKGAPAPAACAVLPVACP